MYDAFSEVVSRRELLCTMDYDEASRVCIDLTSGSR